MTGVDPHGPDNVVADDLDGCLSDVENIDAEQTADRDIDGVVLFADIDPTDEDAVLARMVEYDELFGGTH